MISLRTSTFPNSFIPLSRAVCPEDLSAIVAQNILYHMQIPDILCWTVEGPARVFARHEGASALLGVEVDEKSIRLQRPLGPKGWEIYYEEIRTRRREGFGILAAGLLEEDLPRFRQETGFQGEFLRDNIYFQNLNGFDPELRGNAYKALRQSVRLLEEDRGLRVEEFLPEKDAPAARRVYEIWEAHHPRQGTHWIPDFLKVARGRFLTLSAFQGDSLQAVASSFVAGSYAYMALAIHNVRFARVCGVLDYHLLCKLKERQVRRVDWGVSPTKGLIQYKKKFGKMEEVVIHTAWLS